MNKLIYIKDTNSGHKQEARDFAASLINKLREYQLEKEVRVVHVADIGVYNCGLALRILPNDYLYKNVSFADVARIVEKSLIKGERIEELASDRPSKQLRIVLRNCGAIDPENIEEYIAVGGYQALALALEKGPDYVIEEMKTSGLRGRGGAGFFTWMKWNISRAVEAERKYIICNGDEGDPGAYMDRSVLEGDPHSVIEGMLIGGFTAGATKGFFYIRAEYPLAIARIQKAIDLAYEYGLLGKDILGSGFSFDAEVRLGAGAFVCGEETALIASIEGKRGYPRPRPPYPSVKGLWGRPTIINNVETLANVPYVLYHGGKRFASIGTGTSKGTKVFALTGKVTNSGLIEVPMGISIREIVFEIGGGVLNDKKIKAVQTGGPSGGIIPAQFFETGVDYENLQKLGSIMGSGGMIVMDEDDCVVDIAKFFLGFCVDESCGKCSPCRIGSTQMLHILEKISTGRGIKEDLTTLRTIAHAMQKASLCGLGQTAANPVLSTLRYFEEEYLMHIEKRICPSGKCKAMVNYIIDQEVCKRCNLCMRRCPVGAIVGDKERGFIILKDKCIKCGECFEVCKFGTINRH